MHDMGSITSEYTQARNSLEKLVKEGDPRLASGAEELIINLDAHYELLKHRITAAVPLQYALTAPLPPPIDRRKVKGILAYRAWDMQVKGVLSPAIVCRDGAWKGEVSFADTPPTTHNGHGLHANRLEYWSANRYHDFITGIVDLYGTVIEHGDGVMRAECARILCIFVKLTTIDQNLILLTGVYETIKYRYPNIPVYVVSEYTRELMMWREVLLNCRAMSSSW